MPELLDGWLAKIERRHFKPIDMGLDRCGLVYRNLGSPRPARHVFGIAGTNGKGSVAAYLSGIAGAAGLRRAAYTSPHILRFNERIMIRGQPAPDDVIVSAFEKVEAALGGISLTYFEFTTLAAFILMHEARLDVAVLEVGLGGRLDAVNLVDADCAVITSIGLDHEDYLGHDRESIGFEKAGIMRAWRPVVCGDRNPPASIAAQAGRLSARLFTLGRDFDMHEGEEGLQFSMGDTRLTVERPPLPGHHQVDNLAAALAALKVTLPGVMQDPRSLSRGIAGVCISGRLQRFAPDPRLLLDVGHNPLAAGVVAGHLAGRAAGRCYCVLGMLKDKDAEGVAQALQSPVDEWLCAGLEGARGQSGAELAARILEHLGAAQVNGYASVADALSAARDKAADNDTVLVFGSFQTVAAALRHMGVDSVQGPAMLIESSGPEPD